MSSKQSAEAAITNLKDKRAKDKVEQKELDAEIKSAQVPKKKLKGTPTDIKAAVKKAVVKSSGATNIDAKPSDEYNKEMHKHKGALFNAIEGLSADPSGNNLNAATAAGIAMARHVLDRSSGANDNAHEIYAESSRNMPPGITSAGFLDELDDE